MNDGPTPGIKHSAFADRCPKDLDKLKKVQRRERENDLWNENWMDGMKTQSEGEFVWGNSIDTTEF